MPEQEKQHRKPCATCPFLKSVEPGELGGSPAEVYVGQTYLPFWVPCHERMDYSDPNWKERHQTPQCAGHAIMRSKCQVAHLMPDALLHVPASVNDRVFDSLAHFYAHHKKITLFEAKQILTDEGIHAMCEAEWLRSGRKVYPKGTIPKPQ